MIKVVTLRPAFLFPDGIGTLPDSLLVGDLSISLGDRRDNLRLRLRRRCSCCHEFWSSASFIGALIVSHRLVRYSSSSSLKPTFRVTW
jgi:hypothetical protein